MAYESYKINQPKQPANITSKARKRERPSKVVPSPPRAIRPDNKPSYEVGYGKPPKKNQFKPGQSGNPNGRPKKKDPKSIKAIVVGELMKPTTITENGKIVTLPSFQVSLRRLGVEAAKGNISAIRLASKLANEFMTSGHDEISLSPEQELFLQEILNDE